MRKERTDIRSLNGKNTLHVVVWEPEGEIRGIVQISHGMIEYIERYDEFARFLNEAGYLVVGNDHLGHGHTAAGDEELGYFGEGMSRTVIEDLHAVTRAVKETYGTAVPYYLFGHSMGSFMARRYLMTYGEELDGAILCGTGYTSPAVLGLGKFVAGIIQQIKGDRHRSALLRALAFGSYNRRIPHAKTGTDWISRNEENVAAYNRDKYCTFWFTVNGYQTLFDVLTYIQKRENYEKIPKNLPLYFIAGREDPVGNYGKSVEKIAAQYVAAGVRQVECKLYEKDRHELTNELDREQVFRDILDWLKLHAH